MKYIPKLLCRNVNVTPTSPLKDFAVLLSGVSLLIVVVYVALGMAVDFMVPRISPETEKLLGRLLKSNWTTDGEFSKQKQEIQEILDRMQEGCGSLPSHLEIDIAQSDMINALALPGGRIVVLTGLLEKVQSENELAFVLGHEMGHFANRDHLSEMGRGLVFMVMSVGVFGPNSFVGKQLGKLLHVSELGFSRKHESMADKYALGVQNCYYGHIAGTRDFFTHTAKLKKNRFAGHYLSSHPDIADRVSAIDQLAREKGYREDGKKVPFSMVFPVKKRKPGGD